MTPTPLSKPAAWMCEFVREDGSTDTQVVLDDPEGTRWADVADGDGVSPYRVTPLYAQPVRGEALPAEQPKSDKSYAVAAVGSDLPGVPLGSGSASLSSCGCSSYTIDGKTTESKCAMHKNAPASASPVEAVEVRAEFKAWASDKMRGILKPESLMMLGGDKRTAYYSDAATAWAWSAWQAARTLVAQPPQAVQEVDLLQTDAYAEGRRDEQQELSSVLPGVLYMDPPDGGAPTILEQLQRQARDAARYVWLRDLIAPPWALYFQEAGAFMGTRQHDPGSRNSTEALDAAIDAAISPTTKEN